MIYINLFLTFFQIGAVSFGGGYAMISLIREKALMYDWLTESSLMNMIAVSESTPGPIAVNMATFVGSTQGGALGAVLATLGVVLPSFIIILFIASIVKNFLKYNGVQAFLSGVRPCIVGLIIATAVTFFLSNILGFEHFGTGINIDYKGLILLALIFVSGFLSKKIFKKKISPIVMIIASAILGVIIY